MFACMIRCRAAIHRPLLTLAAIILSNPSCGVYRPVSTLLQRDVPSSQPAPIVPDLGGCVEATDGFVATFNNSVINGEIAVTVKGPNDASRPQIEIIDFSGIVVVETTPADCQKLTVRFTPPTTTLYSIHVNECGPIDGPAIYELTVTQAD